jgi:putative addiction module component (TIGR02574 family)
MSTLNEIYQKALGMGPAERAELAHRLILSLEPDERDPDWEEAWAREIEKRLDSIDRGEVELLDVDSVLADLRKSLKKR